MSADVKRIQGYELEKDPQSVWTEVQTDLPYPAYFRHDDAGKQWRYSLGVEYAGT